MTESITTTEGMAQSIIPYFSDGKKGLYLSYIVANFSIREAAKLAKISERAIRYWREQDPEFAKVEHEGLTALRKQLAIEFTDMEFSRNFRLVLAKDFNILWKDATATLSEEEEKYLREIRKYYTPQQLAMIKQLVGGGDGAKEAFDFTKTVLTIRLEKEQGTVREV